MHLVVDCSDETERTAAATALTGSAHLRLPRVQLGAMAARSMTGMLRVQLLDCSVKSSVMDPGRVERECLNDWQPITHW